MDFVVSKVVMSICALMVVGILGAMFSANPLLDPKGELESVADDFCSVADSAAVSMAHASMTWTIPFTSSGGTIHFELERSIVRMESGSDKVVVRPICDIRTWVCIGAILNSTELEALDWGSPKLVADSGDILELDSRTVLLNNENRILVFASLRT
jgi:hypothetical protein